MLKEKRQLVRGNISHAVSPMISLKTTKNVFNKSNQIFLAPFQYEHETLQFSHTIQTMQVFCCLEVFRLRNEELLMSDMNIFYR